MTKFAPKAHLTAIIDNWDSYYVARAKAVLDGTWKSEDVWDGLKPGMVEIPKDVVALAKRAEADIKSGKRHPFQGPVRNQAGKVVIPEGKTADDKMLLSMDWYVEGVQGKLPGK